MLHHMLRAAAQRAFSTLDPYFNYVTMLLHGDGTNGAQNNTFVDSSTNNFVITRNGNTTQGTFTPYGSNWSNYFDGSGDYLSVANNAALQWSTGDFCVEAWIYPNSVSGSKAIVCKGTNDTGTFDLGLYGTKIELYTTALVFSSSASLSANTWTHIAVTRSGTTLRCFINGALDTTVTSSYNFNNAGTFYVGVYGSGSVNYFNGYMSNVRCVKGSAVYTSAFTPSTTPLTAITNTSLLTCQSNRFIDNSTNNFTITKNGDTSVQRFSPFSPTTAYSTSVIGGSGYFDGSGDYLTAPTSSSFNLFNQTNATVEFWVYLNSYSSDQDPVSYYASGSSEWFCQLAGGQAGQPIKWWVDGSGQNVAGNTTSSTFPIKAWHHLAFVKSGSNWTIYLNGAQLATAATAPSVSISGTLYVGGRTSTINLVNGYLADVRITNTVVYSSAFTPPTAPLTAISGTQLLLNNTNAGILDNAMMNDLETVGNAQISTSVKKYGTGSIALDGTGDYLQGPNNPNLQMGSGSFTIEMWLYTPSLPSAYKRVFGITAPTISAATDESVNLEITNTNKMGATCVVGSTYYSVTDTTDIPTNTWTHWAFVRNGSTLTLYRDGTSVSSTSISGTSNWSTTFNVYVGRWVSSSARDYNGYIDDLRITKGVARYTTTFTPPTAAFPNN